MHDVPSIRAKVEALRPYLDERRRRLWAAAEAMVLRRGGVTATGLERKTIRAGIGELRASPTPSTEADTATAADRWDVRVHRWDTGVMRAGWCDDAVEQVQRC
jgi:hypothetical protein